MTIVTEGTLWELAEAHWPSHQAHIGEWGFGGVHHTSPKKLTSLLLGSCPFPPAVRYLRGGHLPGGHLPGDHLPPPSPHSLPEGGQRGPGWSPSSTGKKFGAYLAGGGGHRIPEPHKHLLPVESFFSYLLKTTSGGEPQEKRKSRCQPVTQNNHFAHCLYFPTNFVFFKKDNKTIVLSAN